MIRRRDLWWACWLAGALGSFAALEARGLLGEHPTLSESLSHWLGAERNDVGLILFGTGCLCLTLHLARYPTSKIKER